MLKKYLIEVYNHQYLPLLSELDAEEQTVLNNVLKLSAGVVSAYAVEYDNTLPYDYFTKEIHKLHPKLPKKDKQKSKKVKQVKEAKTFKRCPNGYRRNKVTGDCDKK